jgi:hypothetical protein
MTEEKKRFTFGNLNQVKCSACGKTVYPLEKVTTQEGGSFHKACFRCELCGGTLRPGYYIFVENKYYCKQHHELLIPPSETRPDDAQQHRQNAQPLLFDSLTETETQNGVVQESIASVTKLKEKFETKPEEESVRSPAPARSLDELLEADQRGQAPLPELAIEPHDNQEALPFLYYHPLLFHFFRQEIERQREEENVDYASMSTTRFVNDPPSEPTYKVNTDHAHFQLLNLLELNSEKNALYFYGGENDECHVYRLELATGEIKKVEQITLRGLHCISSCYGFLAVCNGSNVQVLRESTGELVEGDWNEQSPGGQTNGVVIGLIRETTADETIVLLISRNGGELAIFNIIETANHKFKGELRQFINVDLNVNYAALGTYALSKYLIGAPDYGAGPLVFEIGDDGLFHRKDIGLYFPQKNTSAMHCSWQTQGTLLALATERGDCVVWDFTTKKIVKVLTHCKRMKTQLEGKKGDKKSNPKEMQPEAQLNSSHNDSNNNTNVTSNAREQSDKVSKLEETENDNIQNADNEKTERAENEVASTTSDDDTDRIIDFGSVFVRLCKFNPFPLFNYILVYAEFERFVHIVDTRSWDHQIIQYPLDELINGLCFSPDGRKLYVAHTKGISVYEFRFRTTLVEECLHFINKNRKLKDVYEWDFAKLPLDLQYKLNMNN